MKDEKLQIEEINEWIIKRLDCILAQSNHGDCLDRLNEAQKIFYFCQVFEMEINNGGFNQFFFNSTGDYAIETLESLSIIGATNCVNLLKMAIEGFLNGSVPKKQKKRRKIMFKFEDKLELLCDQLDQQFYKYEDDLMHLNYNYLLEHAADFE